MRDQIVAAITNPNLFAIILFFVVGCLIAANLMVRRQPLEHIERLDEESKRMIKTQTVLPSADTAAMLLWALLASGQICMRKVDGSQTLAAKPID